MSNLSNFMEFSQWDLPLNLIDQLSNLLKSSLSSQQLKSQQLDNVFMAAYLVAYLVGNKANVVKTSLAFLLCVIIDYAIVQIVDGWQLYCVMAIIYAITTTQITSIKTSLACCIMTLFMIYMAIDEAQYGTAQTWIHVETVQTWAWLHYELAVGAVHGLIIAACIDWRVKSFRNSMGRAFNYMRSFVRALRSAACL